MPWSKKDLEEMEESLEDGKIEKQKKKCFKWKRWWYR